MTTTHRQTPAGARALAPAVEIPHRPVRAGTGCGRDRAGHAALSLSFALLVACGPSGAGYTFECDDAGRGLSAVDVLEATGAHATFLDLMSEADPEGYEILADPVLADKTLWAPTDAAFAAVEDLVSSLSDAALMEVLGFHITPPRRSPEGPYPIITPELLFDEDYMVHQTRTGILTGSDQRVMTVIRRGVLTVEEAEILPTAWCTQSGSVFAIDAVIAEATPEPWND